MPDVLDFLPIFQETILSIRSRMDADFNAGVDPADPHFYDTTEGGIYFDLSQTVALEAERLWDAMATEVPAAMFPAYAWGEFLDLHGETVNLPRKAAVKATGTVTFTGTPGTLIPTGTQIETVQVDPDADPVAFEVTVGGTIPGGGSVDVIVEAVDEGVAANVAVGTITILLTPINGVASITNPTATSGGAEIESDELYRQRILLEYAAPRGAGTAADYVRWSIAYPDVGFATVQPLWAGAGTVRVIVTDQQNNPSSTAVVNGLQAVLDPVPQQGQGLAPVGALVTVATATSLTVTVSAVLTLRAGYTLDGTGGTIAVRQAIIDEIKDYIDSLPPGGTVIREHVTAQFFNVDGVYDVSTVLLNGATSNVTVTALQVPRTGTVTLT